MLSLPKVPILHRSLTKIMTRPYQTAPSEAYTASTYQRKEDHKPKVGNESEDLYILSLKTDPKHQAHMSQLRKQYFPAKLLKVDAHITLFHALPGSQLDIITSDLTSLSSSTRSFPIAAQKPFRMAKGVGMSVSGLAEAESIFTELQSKWWDSLSTQDRRKFKGHYTLMNKVNDEDEIVKCLHELKRESTCCEGVVTGLQLFRYDRGFWRHREDFQFHSVPPQGV
ncbi:hypothetical protein F5Y18DRAFT_408105 [Xylariaceae sp. FL1019]|nr:hypothetical protein F5Y18DRAFT_408105 [Xylariaceae sp. FL1019]